MLGWMRMQRLLLVCVGGALGSGARYLVSEWAAARFGTAFPWGTLAVNAVGSFLIGAVLCISAGTEWISPTVRIAITAGILGGFTTYSAFNAETIASLQRGAWSTAAANVVATLLVCLAAGFLGIGAGRLAAGS